MTVRMEVKTLRCNEANLGNPKRQTTELYKYDIGENDAIFFFFSLVCTKENKKKIKLRARLFVIIFIKYLHCHGGHACCGYTLALRQQELDCTQSGSVLGMVERKHETEICHTENEFLCVCSESSWHSCLESTSAKSYSHTWCLICRKLKWVCLAKTI